MGHSKYFRSSIGSLSPIRIAAMLAAVVLSYAGNLLWLYFWGTTLTRLVVSVYLSFQVFPIASIASDIVLIVAAHLGAALVYLPMTLQSLYLSTCVRRQFASPSFSLETIWAFFLLFPGFGGILTYINLFPLGSP